MAELVSPCCGKPCQMRGTSSGNAMEAQTRWYECSACGKPCDPVDTANSRDCKHGALARSCSICELEIEVGELREALAPFALFASALKSLKPHYSVLQYGHQSLSAACFYDARAQFPELDAVSKDAKDEEKV